MKRKPTEAEKRIARAWAERYVFQFGDHPDEDIQREYEHALAILVFANAPTPAP